MAPRGLSGFKEIALDRGVLVFSLILSGMTGVLFGLAPAFQASSANPSASLGEGERGRRAGRGRCQGLRR